MLSKIDPVAQGERLAAEIPIKERTLYFCPSPLYGYGLSLLLEKLPLNSAVLCAEADEKLFTISLNALVKNSGALSCFYESGNPRLLALLQVSDPERLCAFVRETWGERAFKRVELIRLTGGWQLFPLLYDDLAQALRREIALEWGNAMTLIHLGRLYARNLIRNLALLPKSENIKNLNFFSSPVLALGAGPSLDSILENFLLFWKGKIPGPEERRFKIICVDTCLPALTQRSILPDLVVILESQQWNLRDFVGAQGRKIDAIIDLSSLAASARLLAGRQYFFSTCWTELGLFRRLEEARLLPETLAPLGSVGISAAALALRMGSGTVLTGGIDFSYTIDAYHARSTPGSIDRELSQNRFKSIARLDAAFRERTFSTLSKTGSSVRSDPVMRNYRDLFEQEFGGNPRILDIEGPGLNLGVKTISPAEAFAVLNEAREVPVSVPPLREPPFTGEKIAAFIRGEINILAELKDMLSGSVPLDPACLKELLGSADYLWAHFPEFAGSRSPPSANLSFLKRVRIEIEPFLKLWEKSLGELSN